MAVVKGLRARMIVRPGPGYRVSEIESQDRVTIVNLL
jgi:hypothetical protein